MDGSAAITDSTDWTSTRLPAFASLDSALRCQVCKDFYTTPMMTSCSHTFCSLCIRRCLSSDGKCPACRSGDQTSKLRRNWAVEEVVDAFKANRQAVFDLATRAEAVLEISKNAVNGQKRKRGALSGRTADQPSRETRRTRQQTQREGASQDIVAVDSDAEGSDLEYVDETERQPQEEPDDGLVPCPICKHRMKEEAVFGHLDKCTGIPPEPPKPRTKSLLQSSSASPAPGSPFPPPARIPQLNYSLLKDNALRKKLQELGISSAGSRQQLIKRHTEWADLFNANCDSSHPRPLSALKQELNNWERSQAPQPGVGGFVSGGVVAQNQVMAKDFDGDGWKQRHKDQFSDLVAQARARARAAKEAENSDRDEERRKTPPKPMAETAQARDVSLSSTSASEQSGQYKRRRSSTQLPPDASPISRLFCDAAESIGSPVGSRSPASASPHRRSSLSLEGVRKVPMFQVPEEPMRDLDGATC